MAEKTLNTRILLKYDSLANWTSKNTVLRKGEVAFVAVESVPPVNGATGSTALNPTILYKVGDGETPFNSLNYGNALAADVYGWAKEQSITVTKNGTGNVVASIAWDATLNGGKGGLKYETASVATAEGMEDLQEALNALTEQVNDMYTNAKIDELILAAKTGAETTAANALASARAEISAKIDADVKALADGAVKANTDAINAIEADYLKAADLNSYAKSNDVAATYQTQAAANQVHADFAGRLTALETAPSAGIESTDIANWDDTATRFKAFIDGTAEADSAIDTLVEIQNYMNSDTEAFTALSGRVTTLEAKPGLDKVGTVTAVTAGDGLTGGIAEGGASGTIALSEATKASLAKADSALQEHQDISGKKNLQTAVADQNLSGATVFKGIAQNANGEITVSTRDLTLADIGAEAAGAADNALTAAKKYTDDEITELKQGDIYTLYNNFTHLAAIANTGNVNDLVQTTGDILILDCGGAE